MNLYIENVEISQKYTCTSASVKLTPGLNIICGASNTGKTIILNTIKFLLGGNKPISNDIIEETSIRLIYNGKPFILTRSIGKNSIFISSLYTDTIQYDAKYSNNNKHPVIHHFLLNLLGCNKEPLIISNKNNDRKHLTIPTILNSFYLNETTINSKESILLAKGNKVSPIYLLSSLLFLLTGNSFDKIMTKDSAEVSKAKKEAISVYANSRIKELEYDLNTYNEQLKIYNNINIEEQLEQEIIKLEELNEKLEKEREQLYDTINQLTILKNNQNDLKLLLVSREDLASQYKADIQRLSFITSGNTHLSNDTHHKKCPFCNTPVLIESSTDYTKYAKKELEKIIVQYNGLQENICNIKNNITSNDTAITKLTYLQDSISTNIEQTINPSIKKLKENINEYKHFLELKEKSSTFETMISNLYNTLNDELSHIDSANNIVETFNPRTYFPENFCKEMSNIAKDILEKCNYPNLSSVVFDLDSFDLIINEQKKKDSQGKGFSAFINTILGLTFKEYMSRYAIYNFPILMIDTPQNGLDEGDASLDSMKHGLFMYLIKKYSSKKEQIIIVENNKNLPNIDFENYGVNIIEYTKGKYKSNFKNNSHSLFKT